jgi:NAD(P)-dependent dehydrogenase (short-subunit alcohol dehydrogenase family)
MATKTLDKQGKICLITGATSGIGWVTARDLAKMGAEVVLTGRNVKRGSRAIDRIRKEDSTSKVEFIPMDLSSLEDVREFSADFMARFSRLDVLMNNAGTVLLQRRVNDDGVEMTFAVNHLGHFLLTNLLLRSLKASESARVIVVSSGSHRDAQINFDDLQNENGYNGMKVYGQSKLANLFFTYELSRRLKDEKITVNAMHPGFVSTNLGRDNGWLLHKLIRLVMLTGGSAEDGADTCVYLANSLDVEGVTGEYFKGRKVIPSSQASYDQKAAKQLWDISMKLTGLENGK